ncbi:MAG: hypothetical protein IKL27_06370 [Oscillospiraceae bacterium]|nr:hypothetical protein [Oscillospiraceae bacterium]
MRLIDADYLVNVMIHNCPIEEGGIPVEDFATHNRILAFYPTIDAVPVVRCKDCKFWFRNNGHDKNGCPITDSDIWMDDSDFCSYGERRDDAGNH